jgi:hypothetical protein
MSYCNACKYHTYDQLRNKHYCIANTIALTVTPSEHKPAFCVGHSEKEKEMSDIKLEVGQIWLADYNNTEARKILHIGEICVFYARMDSEGTTVEETSVSPHGFLSDYAAKLLPCWPPKPELKETTCGFNAAVSLDKIGNLVIPKEIMVKLLDAFNILSEGAKE